MQVTFKTMRVVQPPPFSTLTNYVNFSNDME